MNYYKLTMTEFFRDVLRAPLRNHRQSWGAVAEDERTVFLRAWTDRVETIQGRKCVQVLRPDWQPTRFGYGERERHLELVRQGAECFVVMCDPVSPLDTASRAVKYCHKNGMFRGGALVEDGGVLWIPLGEFVTVRDYVSARDLGALK